MTDVDAMTDERGAAEPVSVEMDTWPCPRFAPHPPRRTDGRTSSLEWTADKPTHSRTLEYTCSCRRVVYEFLASGGNFRIRRTVQATPPREAYAGPWRRQVAELMWALVLTGEVSLCVASHFEDSR